MKHQMSQKQLVSLFCVVLLATVVATFSFTRDQGLGPINTPASTTSGHSESKPSASESLVKALNATGSEKSVSPSMKLQVEFEESQNYAAFIAEALKRPSEYGRFYAYMAFTRCIETVSLVNQLPLEAATSTPPEQKKAVAAIRSVATRCSGVAAQYPDAVAFSRAVLDNRGGSDPTFSIYNRLAGASKASGEAVQADLNRALLGGDKFDVSLAIEVGKDFFAQKITSTYDTKPHEDIIDDAFAAASCEISGTCNTSLWILGPCAISGQCGVLNRSEQLRNAYSGGDKEVFDRLKKDILNLAGK
jgi:hypothetical protein